MLRLGSVVQRRGLADVVKSSPKSYFKPALVGVACTTVAGLYYFSTGAATGATTASATTTTITTKKVLDPKEFIKAKIVDKKQLTKDTFYYKLDVPYSGTVASCLLLRLKVGEKNVVRPYTPTSKIGDDIELVIKAYPSGVAKELSKLEKGADVEIKGPLMKIEFKPGGHVGMIAGGTGITPMYQVLRHALEDGKTKFTLLYGSFTEDIILKKELDEMAEKYKDRFRVYYHVANPGKEWKGWKGFQSKEMVVETMPKPGEGMVYVCGSPDMMEAVSGKKAEDKSQGVIKPDSILGKLGYKSEQVYKF